MEQHGAERASIITGGGSGIGRVVAQRLAVDAAVILVGRTAVDLDSACVEIVASGGKAASVVGDVADPETAVRAITCARDRGWIVRNLVANAGVGKSGPFETFDAEVWKRIIDVNVHGAFYFARACLPGMLAAGGGTICLMSSVAGLRGVAYDVAYATSKHALMGMARSLALEYGKRGIVVAPVCPGFVESEMTERTIHGVMERRGVSHDAARARVARANAGGRIISAEEIAEAIAAICSGRRTVRSGEPIVFDGV